MAQYIGLGFLARQKAMKLPRHFHFRDYTYYCSWEDIWDHLYDYFGLTGVPPYSIPAQYAQTWTNVRYSWVHAEERRGIPIRAARYLQNSLGEHMLTLRDDEDNPYDTESDSDSSDDKVDGNGYSSVEDGSGDHHQYHYERGGNYHYYPTKEQGNAYNDLSNEDSNSAHALTRTILAMTALMAATTKQ